MWEDGRIAVEDTFFQDELALYELRPVEDEIGEISEVPELIIESLKCNIQNQANIERQVVAGKSNPQLIRVSIPKNTLLDYSKSYNIKILQARIVFKSSEKWKVNGWTEGQLSTVLNCSREVLV